MLEKYYKYKLDYKNYLLLLKFGSFYETIDNDAFIINKIFNYKLKKLSNTFKSGFPISSLNKVLDKLNECHINYIVIDDDIVLKKDFKNNNYSNYIFNDKEIFYNSLRVEKIIKFLNDNVGSDINDQLSEIEKILF